MGCDPDQDPEGSHVTEQFDGLLTFFASHHAIRAEKVLGLAGVSTRLIPGPKELSPNCGTALRFFHAQRDEASAILSQHHVQIDEIHVYRPLSDDRVAAGRSRSRFRRGRR